MNVNSLRKQFPILVKHRKLAYLDNAATSQKPKVVIDAMDAFYRHENAPVHRSVYKLAANATEKYEHVRDQTRGFINAKHREEIVFTAGTTASINTVVNGIARSLKKGDRILLTEMEHHSMIVPWQALAKWRGFKIDFAPLASDGRLDMAAFKRILSKRTKFVGITHISNVLGTVNPVREIIRRAHRVGALVLVDAAQSAAHIPLDVRLLDCDFLVFSGHKIYGPNGIGVLYGKLPLLKRLPPFIYGGHMIERVGKEGTTYAEPPARFEGGTQPVAEVIGLGAAITFLQKFGWKSIRKHEEELTAYALAALGSVSGLMLLGPRNAKDRAPIFSFAIPGVHPHDGSALLDREGIAVRGGHHCTQILHESFPLAGSMRASLGLYNTKEEIDRLVQALHKVQKKFHD